MDELEAAVAQAFRLRGKSRLTRTEFSFALSYELKWFTPEESKDVLEAALKRGLLKEAGGKLSPGFNVKAFDVPGDFKPSPGVLEKKSLFDRILDLFVMAGIGREAALAMITKKEEDYGGLVTPEVAALIIARSKKLNVEQYIDEEYRQLLGKKG